jgi:hypothetical protein
LEGGVLTYGKTPSEIARGRTHGRIDVGTAVVSAKTEMCRIDIDEEECIHHIKVRSNNLRSDHLRSKTSYLISNTAIYWVNSQTPRAKEIANTVPQGEKVQTLKTKVVLQS